MKATTVEVPFQREQSSKQIRLIMNSCEENDEYPEQLDCAWIGSDQAGHVAVFATGGAGPIPDSLFGNPKARLVDIEEMALNLPESSSVGFCASVKNPYSYLQLAKRGLYVYDWNDVHRSIRDHTNQYERVAEPTHPMTVSDLPETLSSVATDVVFSGKSFACSDQLDVRAHFHCRESVLNEK